MSAARKATAAVRTGSVETPVERIGNSPGTTVPLVVTPLNGSARPRASASFDIWRKRAVRSAGLDCCESALAPAKAHSARSIATEANSVFFVIGRPLYPPEASGGRDRQRVAAGVSYSNR